MPTIRTHLTTMQLQVHTRKNRFISAAAVLLRTADPAGVAVAALIIGLFVRKPFIGLNEFVEEKLEESELF